MECLIMGGSGVGYPHTYKHTLIQITKGVERFLLQIGGVSSDSDSNHIVFMGDQNAKIRRDTEPWRSVIVRQEEETMHRNGWRLLSHCAANNWLTDTLSSTGRAINSHAWDYLSNSLEINDRLVIVGRGIRSGVADVRVIGADVGSGQI